MPVPCSMNLASRDSYSPVLNLELGRVQVDTGHIMPQPVIYRCLEKLTKISHWKCLFYLALEISSFVREWWMPQFFFKSFIGENEWWWGLGTVQVAESHPRWYDQPNAAGKNPRHAWPPAVNSYGFPRTRKLGGSWVPKKVTATAIGVHHFSHT